MIRMPEGADNAHTFSGSMAPEMMKSPVDLSESFFHHSMLFFAVCIRPSIKWALKILESNLRFFLFSHLFPQEIQRELNLHNMLTDVLQIACYSVF